MDSSLGSHGTENIMRYCDNRSKALISFFETYPESPKIMTLSKTFRLDAIFAGHVQKAGKNGKRKRKSSYGDDRIMIKIDY